MADYEEIRKLYAKTLVEVTSNASRWTSFLRTAARISPYSFVEQILIYAQRPKATACADYNLWHTRMRRQVKRGTKGIAVPDGRGKLKYLFDVSDTVELPGAFSPQLWEMKPEFSTQIAKKLAQKYQLYGSADTIREVIFDISTKQANLMWGKYGQSIINNARTADQTVPEMTLENTYCNFVSESLRYAALSRCEPDINYDFSLDDMYFELIDRYGMVSAIGSGIQESMKQLFNDIKNEVKVLEEAQERSKDGLLRTEKERVFGGMAPGCTRGIREERDIREVSGIYRPDSGRNEGKTDRADNSEGQRRNPGQGTGAAEMGKSNAGDSDGSRFNRDEGTDSDPVNNQNEEQKAEEKDEKSLTSAFLVPYVVCEWSESAAFEDGKYEGNFSFRVEEGEEPVLGVRKIGKITNDWTCFDNFRLYYYGDGDANMPDDFVSSVEEAVADGKATVVSSAWYTINGVRVAEPKQRGIYIRQDKMSDGTTQSVKVMVR